MANSHVKWNQEPRRTRIAGVWRNGEFAQIVPAAILAVTLGYACAKVSTELSRAPILERKLYGVEVDGFVERIEPRTSRGPRVTLRVIKIGNRPKVATPYRVRVRLLKPAPDLRPGNRVRLKAVLAPPARPALPGGYDFARSAFFQRIGAVGYVRGPPVQVDTNVAPPIGLQVSAAIQRVRQAIGLRITSALSGETGAIANALMTGERGGITRTTLDAYRDSGLLHILSISGLHMAIMGGTVFFAARLLLALWPVLVLNYAIKKWAASFDHCGFCLPADFWLNACHATRVRYDSYYDACHHVG